MNIPFDFFPSGFFSFVIFFYKISVKKTKTNHSQMSAPTPLRAKVRYPVCPLASQLGLATMIGCGRPEEGGVFGAAAVVAPPPPSSSSSPRCLFFLPLFLLLLFFLPLLPLPLPLPLLPPTKSSTSLSLRTSYPRSKTSCVANPTKPHLAISLIVRCTCSTQGLNEQQTPSGRRQRAADATALQGDGRSRKQASASPASSKSAPKPSAWMSLSRGMTTPGPPPPSSPPGDDRPCLSNSSLALAALPA